MSATKLRGRARQETRVRVSSSIAPTITYVGYTSSRAALLFWPRRLELFRYARRASGAGAPCKFHADDLGPQPPLDAGGVENAGRNLLDRALRGIERGDAQAGDQRLGGAQLVTYLLLGRVTALRPALVADLLQALGLYGEGIKLATMRLEPGGKLSGFEVVFGEWVIGREHPVLQRQIETGRGLARTGDSDQYDIGMLIVSARAIIVGQRKVGGVDARRIGAQIGHAVRPARPVRGAGVELAFQRADEGGEEVEEEAISAHYHVAQLILHERAEYDRPESFLLRGAVDPAHRLLRLVKGGHKWQSHGPKLQALELGHEAVTQCFRGHSRLVRHEEYGSTAHGVRLSCYCPRRWIRAPARPSPR